MEIWITIILLVFGLLQIMLFFKLWGMANNVSDIKTKVLKSELINDAKTAYLNGHPDIAKKLLDDGLMYALSECKENHYSQEAKINKERIISTYKYLGIEMPYVKEEKKEAFDWDSNIT